MFDKESIINDDDDKNNLDYRTNSPEIRVYFIFPPKIGL